MKLFENSLQNYCAGKKLAWDFPLNLDGGTAFQQKVWRKLRQIPHGETRSYAWVAAQIGRPKAVRAVGAACGKNPVPIVVPCHRVLQTSGGLGGFSSGLSWKRRLLLLENGQKHAKIKSRRRD